MFSTICLIGFIINATIVLVNMGTDRWEQSLFHFVCAVLLIPGFLGKLK